MRLSRFFLHSFDSQDNCPVPPEHAIYLASLTTMKALRLQVKRLWTLGVLSIGTAL
jgi:hypothetical protein